MILVTHITLAIISTLYASYVAILPSKTKLHITYLLTFGTILSGVVITFTSPLNLGQTCIKGIVYLVFMGMASTIVRKRLSVKGSGLLT